MSARGFASAEMLVGVSLGFAAVLAALALARGVARLGDAAAAESDRALAARYALEVIARDIERAGLGVPASGTDEPFELVLRDAIGVRGDMDRDRAAESLDPEALLDPAGGHVATANDEVVVFYRRTGGRGEATALEADLDGTDHVTSASGTTIARRDGIVDAIDAGPRARESDLRVGTLYRVTFVSDAGHAGTGRFRVTTPLVDDVMRFEVEGFDRDGASVGACGGTDDASARACRASVARVRLALELATRRGVLRVAREVRPVRAGDR